MQIYLGYFGVGCDVGGHDQGSAGLAVQVCTWSNELQISKTQISFLSGPQ